MTRLLQLSCLAAVFVAVLASPYHSQHGHHEHMPEPGSLVPMVEPQKGVIPHGPHGDIHRQNEIVARAYSPTYYQPELVVDYRYLSTHGRAFTKGVGGQTLILPKKAEKEEENYDHLLKKLARHEIPSGHIVSHYDVRVEHDPYERHREEPYHHERHHEHNGRPYGTPSHEHHHERHHPSHRDHDEPEHYKPREHLWY